MFPALGRGLDTCNETTIEFPCLGFPLGEAPVLAMASYAIAESGFFAFTFTQWLSRCDLFENTILVLKSRTPVDWRLADQNLESVEGFRAEIVGR